MILSPAVLFEGGSGRTNFMSENTSASEWANARGEKWLAQLAGMEAMINPVNEPLIRALHLDAACRIVDIGCGGGGATLDILRQSPAGTVVHGVDISPALIEFARTRIQSDRGAIAFDMADMATAPLPNEPYDRLASRFGIMFFDDPRAAFGNLFRWLGPSGRFAFAVWGRLSENHWMAATREVVAEVMDLPSLDSEAPGPFRYCDPEKLIRLLASVGFSEIQVDDWRGALPIGGGLKADEAAAFALSAVSSLGELLAEAGGELVTHARQSLTERFSRNLRDGVVQMDACVHIFTGVRLE